MNTRLWEGVPIAAKTVWCELLAPFPKIDATETVVRQTLNAETKQWPQLWERNPGLEDLSLCREQEPVQGAGAASWDAGGREALHTVGEAEEATSARPLPLPPPPGLFLANRLPYLQCKCELPMPVLDSQGSTQAWGDADLQKAWTRPPHG